MATKAELEAELAVLKQKLADRPEPLEASDNAADSSDEAVSGERSREKSTAIEKILEDHGFQSSDLEDLLTQLSDELGGFPQNKPVLTALGAFALGFILGRMTK